MLSYIIRRIISAVPVLIGVSIFIFLLIHLTPGDPVYMLVADSADQMTEEDIESLRESLGLNEPLFVQYLDFVKGFVTLDFGKSIHSKVLIKDELLPRFGNTAQLAVAAMIISAAFGIIMGVAAATKKGTLIDSAIMSVSMLGISAPEFVFALSFIIIFVSKLSLLPATGMAGSIFSPEGIRSFILPAFSIGMAGSASIARMTRTSVLEVLNEDYVRTVKAKGVRHLNVLFKHVLRNASIPILTIMGVQFGYLLGGTVIIETIFAWPGIGKYLVDAINSRDYPIVQTCVMFIAIIFAVINLMVDILYGILDPRISYD